MEPVVEVRTGTGVASSVNVNNDNNAVEGDAIDLTGSYFGAPTSVTALFADAKSWGDDGSGEVQASHMVSVRGLGSLAEMVQRGCDELALDDEATRNAVLVLLLGGERIRLPRVGESFDWDALLQLSDAPLLIAVHSRDSIKRWRNVVLWHDFHASRTGPQATGGAAPVPARPVPAAAAPAPASSTSEQAALAIEHVMATPDSTVGALGLPLPESWLDWLDATLPIAISMLMFAISLTYTDKWLLCLIVCLTGALGFLLGLKKTPFSLAFGLERLADPIPQRERAPPPPQQQQQQQQQRQPVGNEGGGTGARVRRLLANAHTGARSVRDMWGNLDAPASQQHVRTLVAAGMDVLDDVQALRASKMDQNWDELIDEVLDLQEGP